MRSPFLMLPLAVALAAGCAKEPAAPTVDPVAEKPAAAVNTVSRSHDESSYAEPDKVVVKDLQLDLNVDFDQKRIGGIATYALEWKSKDAALREMYRVLKVGGQARVLEFSEVTADWFKPIYDFHSFKVLPRLGKLFARGDGDSYQYLAESIRKHPPQEELKAMMAEAGFARCHYKNLSGGIVAIHSGYKI